MNENLGNMLTPQEQEENDRIAYFLEKYASPIVKEEEKRDPTPEINQLENVFVDFESKFSLEELHKITEITFEESRNHPLREPARVALFPMTAILKILKEETTISPEQLEALKLKYKKLSQAVGIMNKNIIDHTR